jgi:hypothetical protein
MTEFHKGVDTHISGNTIFAASLTKAFKKIGAASFSKPPVLPINLSIEFMTANNNIIK